MPRLLRRLLTHCHRQRQRGGGEGKGGDGEQEQSHVHRAGLQSHHVLRGGREKKEGEERPLPLTRDTHNGKGVVANDASRSMHARRGHATSCQLAAVAEHAKQGATEASAAGSCSSRA